MPSCRPVAPHRTVIGPVLSAVLLLSISGCPGRSGPGMGDSGGIRPVVEVRDIRVLIASGREPLRFNVSGGYLLQAGGRTLDPPRPPARWVEVLGRESGLALAGRSYRGLRRVEVRPQPGATFELSRRSPDGGWSPATRYTGHLVLLVRPDGTLLAINHLDVDTYVAGVLTRELYADFHPEAFRAQAVAARTYALYQMSRRAGRDYDVTATESSQVYGGLPQGRGAHRALEAVHYTRGIVATWPSPRGERIFCTYYSSACGGMTQSVTACKPGEPAIPPLSGGVKCDYCRIARGEAYRWQPVRIAKSDLTARLAARYPAVAGLGGIRGVAAAVHPRTGRLCRVRLTGRSGQTHELLAEDFRLAIGSRVMRSTNCRLTDEGEAIVLSDGRGFGHGMGLCQWGMQGQALQGRLAGQILKYYYPGMHLTRAY